MMVIFYVLLTMPLIISFDNDQLDAHLLYFTYVTTILYMFRALHVHHQEVELY